MHNAGRDQDRGLPDHLQKLGVIELLAKALIAVLEIPEGDGYVARLTDRPARTNREALILWIRSQLENPSEDLGYAVLPELLLALDSLLHPTQEQVR